MVKYLNPFDLINTTINLISDLHQSEIKKSKSRILADIELSDDSSIVIKGASGIKEAKQDKQE